MLDLERLATAEKYYREAGYTPVETPWIIGPEGYFATAPKDKDMVPFVTLGGYLVASGEQGFLQLMLGGRDPGRAYTTTPCFRHERYDDLHQPYFMKVELIDTHDVTEAGLARVLGDARTLFEQFIETRVEAIGDGSYDIVAADTGIELGSYGIREKFGLRWVYGTGLAEPRLAMAIAKSKTARSGGF
jgi:hypothetical protein